MSLSAFRIAERFMAMSDETWARHANPLSGLTRFTVLPLIVLAIWSRVWLGWGCLIPLTAALAWNWINPRLFAPPERFDSWFSKGVLGERIFLSHPDRVADHHFRMAHILTWASLPGLGLMIIGLIWLWWEGAVFGTILVILPKVWFVDRMVWIYEDWRRAERPMPGGGRDDI